MKTGARNLITDVDGVLVGQADDPARATGTTAIVFERPAVAACDLRGGGPGTRDTELLHPARTVEAIDAIVLSGGSAFGLDAASGAQSFLAANGRGFAIGDARVPIVPSAVLFDLLNGGDKAWGETPPFRDLGRAAAKNAGKAFALGTAGAGYGATVVNLKGGLGSASAVTRDGLTVGAIAAVNAVGAVTIGDGPHFWAAAFEQNGELGNHGLPARLCADALEPRMKGEARVSTTLVVVATDAILNKAQAHRLAVMAQAGMAQAIFPVHTPLDGDIVFAAATGVAPLPDPLMALTRLGAAAAQVTARAIARGVYEAAALPFAGALPAWRDRFSLP
ncbi:P1 family peptidase [Xanthobacteraceae bacterium Astr-EGSB]|uniref:P1 family peptidase n=1 Tax=Astrobacterium formosum TaxID=3069710 RepID=UPI0027B244CB|nr:P1 family peptidase [Xanthobacteraceae bacterium Astr-EGSB]